MIPQITRILAIPRFTSPTVTFAVAGGGGGPGNKFGLSIPIETNVELVNSNSWRS